MRCLRYAMIGGGLGSMIGEAHRQAVSTTEKATLVAACFSQSYEKTLTLGKQLNLTPERLYRTCQDLIDSEIKREDKPDFAVVCTPNSTHYEICKLLLQNGIHVACDKPLTFRIEEAEELKKLAEQNHLCFCVTYTYTAYPSVKKIREMIKEGKIGEIRYVNAEYPQGWLATPCEKEGNAQAAWRCDPKLSGPTNTTGDIGTHIVSIVKKMTDLDIDKVNARLNHLVPERVLDDNMTVMVNYKGGATGLYWACQACIGYDNDLRVRIFGDKGTIQWDNRRPDEIEYITLTDREVTEVPFPNSDDANKFKAFIEIYKNFVSSVQKTIHKETLNNVDMDYPTVDYGLMGVTYINRCLESSQKGSVWVDF